MWISYTYTFTYCRYAHIFLPILYLYKHGLQGKPQCSCATGWMLTWCNVLGWPSLKPKVLTAKTEISRSEKTAKIPSLLLRGDWFAAEISAQFLFSSPREKHWKPGFSLKAKIPRVSHHGNSGVWGAAWPMVGGPLLRGGGKNRKLRREFEQNTSSSGFKVMVLVSKSIHQNDIPIKFIKISDFRRCSCWKWGVWCKSDLKNPMLLVIFNISTNPRSSLKGGFYKPTCQKGSVLCFLAVLQLHDF